MNFLDLLIKLDWQLLGLWNDLLHSKFVFPLSYFLSWKVFNLLMVLGHFLSQISVAMNIYSGC